jgi:tetratricopeptide (TPR) repeat protein
MPTVATVGRPLPPPASTRGSAWLRAVRERPWLAASLGFALIGVASFVIAHALQTPRGAQPPLTATSAPAAPPPVAAAPAPVVTPVAAPSPPPQPAAVAAKEPAAPADPGVSGPHRKAHHAAAHERRGAHERKPHSSHATRQTHRKEVALKETPAPSAPSPSGDEGAARAAYAKGNRLLLTGDTGGAIAAYEEATRLAPNSPAGYRGLGLAYEKQGKPTEAARAFRRYLKLAPGSEDRALVAERLQRLAPSRKPGKRP